jgi:hypothetical protein
MSSTCEVPGKMHWLWGSATQRIYHTPGLQNNLKASAKKGPPLQRSATISICYSNASAAPTGPLLWRREAVRTIVGEPHAHALSAFGSHPHAGMQRVLAGGRL